jgi:hypothetical protein
VQGCGNITRHGEIDTSCKVVPFESYSAVKGAIPICGYVVEVLDGID